MLRWYIQIFHIFQLLENSIKCGFSSLNIVWVIKYIRVRWTKIWAVWGGTWRTPLGKSRCRWQ